ncbi:hypothetical protein L5515_008050 [Caenorhabditis briggsae]|uniref:Anaphase-promoting complex subunit 10 n=2 Tax=Caenorhabditis briggsae TaxID=6238 RepID=A0AAE9A2F5_CAEBR|nr:hypothetical protein L3Y34_008199 [Caenorhabditis briggsae]UMM35414.1 hypothetical protein L5515_008050 [Caenorhabditis briggsae]
MKTAFFRSHNPHRTRMSTKNNFPELSFEVDKTSARGWITSFDQPEFLQDVTREATIELSSVAHCGGVDQLLHDSSDFAWRTNMSPPHQATVTFARKTDVSFLMLYLDYKTDESYCPQEVRVDLGWGTNDWWHRINRRVNYPKGWVKIRLVDRLDAPRRVMALRMTVMKNHEKGRDCVIRHFRIIGPQYHRHDSINRLILGPTGGLGGVTQERQARSHIMNDHLTVR